MLYFITCLFLSSNAGYVQKILSLMFKMTKDELNAQFESYARKIPPTLTSKLENRKEKADAVAAFNRRKEKESVLYPSGK